MSCKAFARFSILTLILLTFLAMPSSAQAGSACGNTYTVQWGDTLSAIAATCGTTLSAMYAANPGIGGTLYAGQVLTVPDYNYNNYSNYNAIPSNPQAGGACGNTYTVQWGDTLSAIAATCGTTLSAMYSANPGIGGTLYAGQVLTVPGYNYNNNSNYYNNAPVNYNGTYIVQFGDSFSEIASRYGVSTNDLEAANPGIYDIDHLYAGQVINVPVGQGNYAPYGQGSYATYGPGSYGPYGPGGYPPASPWFGYWPTPTPEPSSLSYGTAPAGTPQGQVKLSNDANADVYVSLQGTTRDGTDVINEYTVNGTMNVTVPAGWYAYVASVGGREFSGQFNLPGNSSHSITFYSNRVVVQ